MPPPELAPFHSEPPEQQTCGLYQCTTAVDHTFTVEDKDPSVLWQMGSTCLFSYWFYLMTHAPERWEVQAISKETVLKNYRGILDTILPKSLIGVSNAFSSVHIPYAYFTVKYKCFKAAAQQCCGALIPAQPTTKTQPQSHTPHPAHTCNKTGHSCLRNIISFKKVPGRAAFKRVGRAFMHVVREAAPGYGIRDLSKGKKIIERNVGRQLKRDFPVIFQTFRQQPLQASVLC